MKKKFCILSCMLLLLFSCKPELEEAINSPLVPDSALSADESVKTWSWQQVQDLMNDTEEEEKFYEKISLLTYAVTEFIGDHTNFQDGEALSAAFPCDVGFEDHSGGTYRFMSDQSGLSIIDVQSILGLYIASRISDGGGLSEETKKQLFTTVLGSLRMETDTYDLIARKRKSPKPQQTQEFGFSYGFWSNENGDFSATYSNNNATNKTSWKVDLKISQAEEMNVILLDPTPIGGNSYRFNDPCYYETHHGGGGIGGGGGGSGGGGRVVDEFEGGDESFKGFTGSLINPPSGTDCPGYADGLRINRFHLADRNEGGFLGGNSEVFMHATLYRSTDPPASRITDNNLGIKTLACTDFAPVSWNISLGRQLAKVKPSDVSKTVNKIIDVDSDSRPIIESGFCPFPLSGIGQNSYDRLYITFFEMDGGLSGITTRDYQQNDLSESAVGYCPTHWQTCSLESDIWFTNSDFRITYDDFSSHANIIYLVEIPGGYQMQFSMPGAAFSWFELELY